MTVIKGSSCGVISQLRKREGGNTLIKPRMGIAVEKEEPTPTPGNPYGAIKEFVFYAYNLDGGEIGDSGVDARPRYYEPELDVALFDNAWDDGSWALIKDVEYEDPGVMFAGSPYGYPDSFRYGNYSHNLKRQRYYVPTIKRVNIDQNIWSRFDAQATYIKVGDTVLTDIYYQVYAAVTGVVVFRYQNEGEWVLYPSELTVQQVSYPLDITEIPLAWKIYYSADEPMTWDAYKGWDDYDIELTWGEFTKISSSNDVNLYVSTLHQEDPADFPNITEDIWVCFMPVENMCVSLTYQERYYYEQGRDQYNRLTARPWNIDRSGYFSQEVRTVIGLKHEAA